MAITKTMPLNKAQALSFLNELLSNLSNWCNQENPAPRINDLEKFLAKNFELVSNDVSLVKGIDKYLQRLEHLRSKYETFEIIGPLEEPLLCDNKIICYYDLNLGFADGETRDVCIMAIATIENNKVTRWVQVTHDKDNEEHWDT